MSQCITITFGEQVENHIGMQKIGKLAEKGFNLQDLNKAKLVFEQKGYTCELITLECPICDISDYKNNAHLLIVRNGIDCFLGTTKNSNKSLFEELISLKWDTKAKMYGRVVNKHARHNLCFDEKEQAPDYANAKGTIISWDTTPLLKKIQLTLPEYLGEKANKLKVICIMM